MQKSMSVFEPEEYRACEDRKEYIHSLILAALQRRKTSSSHLCMNELADIVSALQLPLKSHQVTQLYLYCTYQPHENLADTKKKIIAILEQQKKRVDTRAAAEWIHGKLENRDISLAPQRVRRAVTTQSPIKKPLKGERLPSLVGSSTQKLQEELRFLIDIFEEMEKERQSSGLIPVSEASEDSDVELPQTNVPYDPQLADLNNKLCRLRITAEDRLGRIIELARDDGRVRRKLEEAIERFQKARIEANEKVGRVGAMKAQKRLQERRQRERNRIRHVQLGEDEDLVRATHLYSLLTLPQIRPNGRIL